MRICYPHKEKTIITGYLQEGYLFKLFRLYRWIFEIRSTDENIFIYLEEIDLCRRVKSFKKKIILDPSIKIKHVGGTSHDNKINYEMELSRNWHWMWSTFYFNKKHYGYFNSLIKVSGKFFSSIIEPY